MHFCDINVKHRHHPKVMPKPFPKPPTTKSMGGILANMLSCSTHFNHQQIIKKSLLNHTKTHTNHNQITEIKQKCRESWEPILINSIKTFRCPCFFYSISRLKTYFWSLNYPIFPMELLFSSLLYRVKGNGVYSRNFGKLTRPTRRAV